MGTSEIAAVEPQLIVERVGSIGRLRLNRPKALNSLTLDMVRRMRKALDNFAQDPAVAAVLVSGEGDRGLCAGGDIRAIYESGRAGTDLAVTFWREEFVLNATISRFPKPYIAIIDGIVMGGGVGVSAHGSHRIVTERTRLALPETGIGYFPDIGATWLLSRGPGDFGTYLGLTGEQIGAADAIEAGLADVFVPSAELAALVDALSALPSGSGQEEIDTALQRFSQPSPPAASNRAAIDRLFAHDSLEAIVAALDAEDSAFAHGTRSVLLTKSPLSLKLTLRLLRLGRTSSTLKACLEREFAAAGKILSTRDFYEGIRAAVIDKDRSPNWSPDSLAAVTDDMVDAYLEPSLTPLFAA
ncbi:enoyl-CoA hydratase/isomerase family protein [Mesorhizobium sp. CO1-1-8]|uniref:enoyl-CoA hydratase/isomerase family protein n=1 Tax=Mesorhizobium sp. CO1-1-8 TaxID=2876631 RepID=UPI001CD142CD|nr:enoyl-CoA hydratase/isomerase family protein [Mesorhizobium sp. CO1-1-8]MBZ9772181.1 enoyl-CoA hydratase/isomerase family protein [Mesorhizobium sp. CO1-1-8]